MNQSKLHKLFAISFLGWSAISFSALAVDAPANSIQLPFPALEQAQPEITKLNGEIEAIEARYEKELANTGKQINQKYAEKLDALKSEHSDEFKSFESAAEFKSEQEKKRDDINSQRDIELAKLNLETVVEPEVAPLKARIKALMEHEYIVGAEGIDVELDSYDAKEHQFTIKFRSKFSALSLKLKATIPLPLEESQEFLKQWQSGLIKPEAKAKLSGELIELVLVNVADNTRWVELKKMFFSPAMLKVLPPATLNDLFQIGSTLQDCPTCPEMIVIPAGNFDMGTNNGSSDENPVHRVTFSQPFAIGKTEVTQGQWRSIMGNNPSNFKNCGDSCPVEQVSWDDANIFIHKLNAKTGKQYRLPTESEWEYTCRAGAKQEYCGGDKLDMVAWSYRNSGGFPHPSALKQANAWGLYDMNGNVWEWVEDGYHADYNGAPSDGTAWQGDGAQHVLRGGSWSLVPELMHATVRSLGAPVLRDYYYGFRVARTLP
jgi:formylglycine-generating enzyme required for sulfatase activity